MATRRTTESARAGQAAQPAEPTAPRRRAARAKPVPATEAATGITVSENTRRAMIAQAAYLRAERRGFAPAGEVEDWLAAEAEVDALLKAGNGSQPQ